MQHGQFKWSIFFFTIFSQIIFGFVVALCDILHDVETKGGLCKSLTPSRIFVQKNKRCPSNCKLQFAGPHSHFEDFQML